MSEEFKGKTPIQILNNTIVNSSSWHFFQALSWLDYAKRSQSPSAVHYAAFELRYGIEYLLFQLLVLTNQGLSPEAYKKCLGNAKQMKKMLAAHGPNYNRLVEFTELLLSLNPQFPRLTYWRVDKLFEYWGIASKYLHFVGAQPLTYNDINWIIAAIAHLEKPLQEIWQNVTSNLGFGLLRVTEMEPEVHEAWVQFSAGSLSREDLVTRMRLVQPLNELRNRQRTI